MRFSNARFVLVATFGCVALLACRKSMDMSNATSTNSPATASVTPPAVAAPTLAPGFTSAAFAPGRYATVVGRVLNGTHSLQVLSEDSTAVFAVELLANGTATATRGWRYISRNDGPQTHSQENYREQQGYRGTFSTHDGVTDIVLNADDTVCPHIFEGEYVLERAKSVTLRCARAVPPAELGVGATPVLLCQVVTADLREFEPQLVEGVAAGEWMVLGSGNGLEVRVTGRPLAARAGEPMQAVVAVAPGPIGLGAWQQRLTDN